MNELQKFRTAAKLSQTALASKVGCSQPTISEIEKGSEPGVGLAQKIVAVICAEGAPCTIADVFPDGTEQQSADTAAA